MELGTPQVLSSRPAHTWPASATSGPARSAARAAEHVKAKIAGKARIGRRGGRAAGSDRLGSSDVAPMRAGQAAAGHSGRGLAGAGPREP